MRGRDKQPKTALWEPNDRSALMRAGGTVQPIEKLISVPLDPDKPKIGQFDLYYFVYPPRVPINGKTVFFCSGGREKKKSQTLFKRRTRIFSLITDTTSCIFTFAGVALVNFPRPSF